VIDPARQKLGVVPLQEHESTQGDGRVGRQVGEAVRVEGGLDRLVAVARDDFARTQKRSEEGGQKSGEQGFLPEERPRAPESVRSPDERGEVHEHR
jgi:hypothetical protein